MNTLPSRKKILIISLDGATLDLIEPLTEQGYMPNLKRLMVNGSYGILRSTIPPCTAPAWASFMTGKNPGKHGVFDFRRFDPEQNIDYFVNSRSIRGKTIWQILSEKGKEVIVLNLPMTYPPYPVKGVLVSGFDTPSVNSRFTYPSELQEEILSRFPEYDFVATWDNDTIDSRPYLNKFIHKISQLLKMRTDLALYLMTERAWDVFMIHFQNIDVIQHALWGYLTQASCFSSSDRLHILQLYRELDTHIGSLIQAAGEEETTKFIISDHGFGSYCGLIYPNSFLHSYGLLSLKKEKNQGIRKIIPDYVKIPYRSIKKLIMRSKDSGKKSWIELKMTTNLTDIIFIDWSKTKACSALGENYALIFLNKKKLNQDIEYESLRNLIIEKLSNERDPMNGLPLFEKIYRAEEIYLGNGDNNSIPDLICIPKEGYSVSVKIPENSFIKRHNNALRGGHRVNGLIITEGNMVAKFPARLSATILDLAPTILYLLDLPIPDDMDGRVLSEIFTSFRKPCYEKAQGQNIGTGEQEQEILFDHQDTYEIKKRLQGLGYLS
jgi:predicted AlkP superfamily phosphohydrolase/phosphomutase